MTNKLVSFLKSHPIIKTAPSRRDLEKRIEKALEDAFPGLKGKITIESSGEWEFKPVKGSKMRFDDQYPGMTREQADAQILEDMKAIIKRFMPDSEFIGYERYGEYTRLDAG